MSEPGKRSELGTRFILGSGMLLAVGGIYWLDLSWTDGIASAVVLGLLALVGCSEYVTMFRKAGFAVSRALLLLLTERLVGDRRRKRVDDRGSSIED